jgi:multicomponent Na+:H+ antiporter subunit E
MFLWNILLALIWAALNGEFSLHNLMVGFLLGYLALYLLSARNVVGSTRYIRRAAHTFSFIVFFLRELTVANVKMAVHVLQKNSGLSPAIVAVPLDVRSDGEIALLSNLICLTPGTLSVDVSTDRTTLYVHALDVPDYDMDLFRLKIKEGFERRVMEVFR